MAQTAELIDALKRELRVKKLTYAAVANAIGLSEASVKRLFSEKSFTLDRLAHVCELVGWDFIDLAKQVQLNQKSIDSLTEEQEREIASDLVLLMVAVSVINGFSYEDLLAYYHLTEHECIQKLAKLDRLKLIELLPGNRIRLRISPNFRWNPNGPIQTFFLESVVEQFFSTRFAQPNEKLVVLNGLLTQQGNEELQEKMDQLASQFVIQGRSDSNKDMHKKQGNTLVLALRQWRFPLFEEHVRK